MTESAADLYLHDYGQHLIELAQAARSRTSEDGVSQFDVGRAAGLYEAVSLLAQQANAFELSMRFVGLPDGFDADRDLLWRVRLQTENRELSRPAGADFLARE